MKVVILAGGLGTRISEESIFKPKPMIDIGSRPMLWHIMKSYSTHGFDDFIILCGYKGYVIKEYFANYFLHQSDVTINLADNSIETHRSKSESWKVTMLSTGLNTMTGGRVLRARDYIGDEPFLLTYGDGVSDVNITELIEFHQSHGKLMTVTSVQPEGRFGSLDVGKDGCVDRFLEKPKGDGGWINAGFFVCEPKVFDYITLGDDTILERDPMANLAKDGELRAFKHFGFWKPMDSMRDSIQLNDLWRSQKAPWKTW